MTPDVLDLPELSHDQLLASSKDPQARSEEQEIEERRARS
jgi:hypothetical protein